MDMSILRQGSNGIFIPLQDQSFHSIENSEMSQPNSQFSDVQPMIQPPVPQNQIVANQLMQPKIIYVDATNFKSSPNNTTCPICKNPITTQINKNCNWYSFLFCYCIGILPWITLQCCRNKDINCYNAEHFCPRCGNKIAEYNSC